MHRELDVTVSNLAATGALVRYDFMRCPLDSCSVNDAIGHIQHRIQLRSSTNLIHFINAAKIVKARSDRKLAAALWDGDFVFADGKPLVPLGRWLGMDIPERINGTNLMTSLLALAAREGYRVYFLGATQHVVEACVQQTLAAHPQLTVAGFRNGYFSPADARDVIESINQAAPDILFIGMGTPQKEMFAYEHRAQLRVPVVQGVGGSFDVVAGLVERAPVWMQDWGLEWLFRVQQEPRRMFWRYFSTNSMFVWFYLVELWRTRVRHLGVHSSIAR